MILQENLELSEAFRLNHIKFNRLILLLNSIFIFTLTLRLRYGCNRRIHLPTGYPHYHWEGKGKGRGKLEEGKEGKEGTFGKTKIETSAQEYINSSKSP